MPEINKTWHEANVMPKNPTKEQRIEWHAEHARACGCRAMPDSLKNEIAKFKKK